MILRNWINRFFAAAQNDSLVILNGAGGGVKDLGQNNEGSGI